jgi:hypothetical protein
VVVVVDGVVEDSTGGPGTTGLYSLVWTLGTE